LMVDGNKFNKCDSGVKPLQFRLGFIRYYVFAAIFFFHPLHTFRKSSRLRTYFSLPSNS
jgi:hypothetical protein